MIVLYGLFLSLVIVVSSFLPPARVVAFGAASTGVIVYEPQFVNELSKNNGKSSPFMQHPTLLHFSIENKDAVSRDFIAVVQLIDTDGFTAFLNETTGKVAAGEIREVTMTYQPEREGYYLTHVFVLDDGSNSPTLLGHYGYLDTQMNNKLSSFWRLDNIKDNGAIRSMLNDCEKGREFCNTLSRVMLQIAYDGCLGLKAFKMDDMYPSCEDARLAKYAS